MKKTYWKVVSDEYPGGAIYENRMDALQDTEDRRSNGESGSYCRKIRMTQEEHDDLQELD